MPAIPRPLSLGEILDRTVQIYRRNFLLLAGIAAPPAACIVAVTGAASVFLSNRAFALAGPGKIGIAAGPSSMADPQMLLLGLAAGLFFLIGLPLLLGVFAIALAALNYAASRVNRGEPATIQASYGYAFRHFWRHIGILFLQFLFAGIIPYFVLAVVVVFAAGVAAALGGRSGQGGAMMALFVVLLVLVMIAWLAVSVLIWLRFSLAYPVSVGENQNAWPSLLRSNRLSKGTRERIFVMFLLVLVLTITITLVLTIPLDVAVGLTSLGRSRNQTPLAVLNFMQVVNLAASFLVRAFVMPVYAIALVVFYTDQRTRLEGYDIEQLMVQAGWSELPASPSPHPTNPQATSDSIESIPAEFIPPNSAQERFEP
jgi:hypothetical protein